MAKVTNWDVLETFLRTGKVPTGVAVLPTRWREPWSREELLEFMEEIDRYSGIGRTY